jgi:chromosome segregation ATPase
LEHSIEEANKYKVEIIELRRQVTLLSENQSKEASIYSTRMSELRELSSKSLSMTTLIGELESALSAKSADSMKANEQLAELMGLLTSNTKEMKALSDEKRHLMEELDKTKRNVSEMSQVLQAKTTEAATWKEQANMNRKLTEESNIKNMAEVDAANQQIAKLFEVIADRNEELKAMALRQQQQDLLIQKMRDFENDRIPVHQIISDMRSSWDGESRVMKEDLQRVKRQVHEISMSSSSGLGETPVSMLFIPNIILFLV